MTDGSLADSGLLTGNCDNLNNLLKGKGRRCAGARFVAEDGFDTLPENCVTDLLVLAKSQ